MSARQSLVDATVRASGDLGVLDWDDSRERRVTPPAPSRPASRAVTAATGAER